MNYWRWVQSKKNHDSWISNKTGFKLQDQVVGVDLEATMSLLIDVDTNKWNRDIIYMTFNNHVAKQILSIPIYVTLPIENVIWHWERMETIQLNQPTIFCVKREIPLYGYFQC
jgi:hypothetical protein